MMSNEKIVFLNKYFIVISVILFLSSCGEKKENSGKISIKKDYTNSAPAKIEFEEKAKDLGTIYRGEIIETDYSFTNTGGKPLMILAVKASCGCTDVTYEKTPILPGEQGKIKIIFDSNGLINNQYKTIKVKTNTKPEETKLILAAFVKFDN